jgi:nucleoside-diphosphate-sugar epimerase
MILVTGGAGLLGQEVITQLIAQNKKVIAIYNKTPLKNFDLNLVTQKKANLLDVIALEDAMEGVTHIYHCAAIVSFDPKERANLLKVNVEGTANIVNIALDKKIEKLVHVSSVSALGRIRENSTIDETMQWTAETSNSVYGDSKHLGEMEVWRGIAEGLNAVIVNPTIILGEADWNNSSTAIFKSVYDEFPWYATGTTGWVDVKDVANIMLQLMENPISNERFIVSGYNDTYQNVFTIIADKFGKKRPHKKVTPFLAGIVWRLEKWKSFFTNQKPLVTKETAKTAITTVYYNNQKLKTALPSFTYAPLENTIERICKSLTNSI